MRSLQIRSAPASVNAFVCMPGDWCNVDTHAYPSSVTGRSSLVQGARSSQEPSFVSLRVSPFPPVWDRILGHRTGASALVATTALIV